MTKQRLTGWSVVLVILAALYLSTLCWAAKEAVPPSADHANPEAITQVLAGDRDTANAVWWGFDPNDSTAAIQAAIDSGAAKVIIPNVGKDWITEPLFLNNDDQEIFFEPGVVRDLYTGKRVARLTSQRRGFRVELRRDFTARLYHLQATEAR